MKDNEYVLLKGNEAIAHAAIRCGCDGFFGYPITPQSEILETLSLLKPWETTGMVVLQAESEVAAINMLYGGGGSGKRVMTTSSSPGVALMQEGMSYMAVCEIPALIVNVQRGGPGLGTIQPSQSDYLQATVGGGNGDYQTIVLSDGVIGQMMEKVVLPPQRPRRTEEEIARECPWAVNGHGVGRRKPNIMTSLELDPAVMEERNLRLQEKYRRIRQSEVRCETYLCDDADIVLTAFGSVARICKEAVGNLRRQGVKAGLLRPITLWPFPEKEIAALAGRAKAIMVAEMNAGQMVRDVRAAVEGRTPVHFYGRMGGMVPSPQEIEDQVKLHLKEINLI